MRRYLLPFLLAAAPLSAQAANHRPPPEPAAPVRAPVIVPQTATLPESAVPAPVMAVLAPAGGLCGHMLEPAVALKQVARGFGGQGRAFHPGLDLTAPYGSPIRAAADGVVVFAGRYYGYGNMVDIRHADGTITRYAHMSAFATGVRPGFVVRGGEVIGRIGTSGHAHGAHVHFEVRINGRPVNPAPFLAMASCAGVPQPDPVEEAQAPDRPIR